MPNAWSMVKDDVIAGIAGFANVPIPMSIWELDGRIVAINEAAERMIGRPASEVVGSKVGDVAPGMEYILNDLIAHAREHGSFSGEISMATPQGPVRSRYLVWVREHAGRHYVISTGQAVVDTRANDAEREARAREEALELFAGGVAHAFNNQLVGVLAEATALRESPALDAPIKDGLRRIEHAGERMAELTRQLLAYTGGKSSATEQIDPDKLLLACEQRSTRCLSPDTRVRVTTSTTRVVVEADRTLLRNVICSLVANSAESFTDNTGSIDITTRVDGMYWVLEVSDTGIGMNAHTQARMFDPFFTTKRDHHGLGLSALHGIVRRFGGHLSVDSELGRGTTICLRLPIVPGATAHRSRPDSQPPPAVASPAFRILVADDEPLVLATVRRLLERRGADVVLAGDGAQARDHLEQGAYQVLLFDANMPKLTGRQLLPVARRLQPNARVILMSGSPERLRAHSIDEPDAFLDKPFTANVFDAAIDSLLVSSVA